MMDIAEALEIVLSLAHDNIIDERDHPEENARQTEAYNIVLDLAVNEYGDD